MSQILNRPAEHWGKQSLKPWSYPFLCAGGANHLWQYTGTERIVWASACTNELPPENAPVMVEKVCSICNADDWEYKSQ